MTVSWNARLRGLAVLIAGLSLVAGCSSVQVIEGTTAPPPLADACEVKVYQTYQQAIQKGPIEELCVINGTSSGSFDHSIATAIKKHKGKACACGASNVYVQSQSDSGWDVATVTLIAFRHTQPPQPETTR